MKKAPYDVVEARVVILGAVGNPDYQATLFQGWSRTTTRSSDDVPQSTREIAHGQDSWAVTVQDASHKAEVGFEILKKGAPPAAVVLAYLPEDEASWLFLQQASTAVAEHSQKTDSLIPIIIVALTESGLPSSDESSSQGDDVSQDPAAATRASPKLWPPAALAPPSGPGSSDWESVQETVFGQWDADALIKVNCDVPAQATSAWKLIFYTIRTAWTSVLEPALNLMSETASGAPAEAAPEAPVSPRSGGQTLVIPLENTSSSKRDPGHVVTPLTAYGPGRFALAISKLHLTSASLIHGVIPALRTATNVGIGITALNLGYNQIGPAGIRSLLRQLPYTITGLYIDHNPGIAYTPEPLALTASPTPTPVRHADSFRSTSSNLASPPTASSSDLRRPTRVPIGAKAGPAAPVTLQDELVRAVDGVMDENLSISWTDDRPPELISSTNIPRKATPWAFVAVLAQSLALAFVIGIPWYSEDPSPIAEGVLLWSSQYPWALLSFVILLSVFFIPLKRSVPLLTKYETQLFPTRQNSQNPIAAISTPVGANPLTPGTAGAVAAAAAARQVNINLPPPKSALPPPTRKALIQWMDPLLRITLVATVAAGLDHARELEVTRTYESRGGVSGRQRALRSTQARLLKETASWGTWSRVWTWIVSLAFVLTYVVPIAVWRALVNAWAAATTASSIPLQVLTVVTGLFYAWLILRTAMLGGDFVQTYHRALPAANFHYFSTPAGIRKFSFNHAWSPRSSFSTVYLMILVPMAFVGLEYATVTAGVMTSTEVVSWMMFLSFSVVLFQAVVPLYWRSKSNVLVLSSYIALASAFIQVRNRALAGPAIASVITVDLIVTFGVLGAIYFLAYLLLWFNTRSWWHFLPPHPASMSTPGAGPGAFVLRPYKAQETATPRSWKELTSLFFVRVHNLLVGETPLDARGPIALDESQVYEPVRRRSSVISMSAAISREIRAANEARVRLPSREPSITSRRSPAGLVRTRASDAIARALAVATPEVPTGPLDSESDRSSNGSDGPNDVLISGAPLTPHPDAGDPAPAPAPAADIGAGVGPPSPPIPPSNDATSNGSSFAEDEPVSQYDGPFAGHPEGEPPRPRRPKTKWRSRLPSVETDSGSLSTDPGVKPVFATYPFPEDAIPDALTLVAPVFQPPPTPPASDGGSERSGDTVPGEPLRAGAVSTTTRGPSASSRSQRSAWSGGASSGSSVHSRSTRSGSSRASSSRGGVPSTASHHSKSSGSSSGRSRGTASSLVPPVGRSGRATTSVSSVSNGTRPPTAFSQGFPSSMSPAPPAPPSSASSEASLASHSSSGPSRSGSDRSLSSTDRSSRRSPSQSTASTRSRRSSSRSRGSSRSRRSSSRSRGSSRSRRSSSRSRGSRSLSGPSSSLSRSGHSATGSSSNASGATRATVRPEQGSTDGSVDTGDSSNGPLNTQDPARAIRRRGSDGSVTTGGSLSYNGSTHTSQGGSNERRRRRGRTGSFGSEDSVRTGQELPPEAPPVPPAPSGSSGSSGSLRTPTHDGPMPSMPTLVTDPEARRITDATSAGPSLPAETTPYLELPPEPSSVPPRLSQASAVPAVTAPAAAAAISQMPSDHGPSNHEEAGDESKTSVSTMASNQGQDVLATDDPTTLTLTENQGTFHGSETTGTVTSLATSTAASEALATDSRATSMASTLASGSVGASTAASTAASGASIPGSSVASTAPSGATSVGESAASSVPSNVTPSYNSNVPLVPGLGRSAPTAVGVNEAHLAHIQEHLKAENALLAAAAGLPEPQEEVQGPPSDLLDGLDPESYARARALAQDLAVRERERKAAMAPPRVPPGSSFYEEGDLTQDAVVDGKFIDYLVPNARDPNMMLSHDEANGVAHIKMKLAEHRSDVRGPGWTPGSGPLSLGFGKTSGRQLIAAAEYLTDAQEVVPPPPSDRVRGRVVVAPNISAPPLLTPGKSQSSRAALLERGAGHIQPLSAPTDHGVQPGGRHFGTRDGIGMMPGSKLAVPLPPRVPVLDMNQANERARWEARVRGATIDDLMNDSPVNASAQMNPEPNATTRAQAATRRAEEARRAGYADEALLQPRFGRNAPPFKIPQRPAPRFEAAAQAAAAGVPTGGVAGEWKAVDSPAHQEKMVRDAQRAAQAAARKEREDRKSFWKTLEDTKAAEDAAREKVRQQEQAAALAGHVKVAAGMHLRAPHRGHFNEVTGSVDGEAPPRPGASFAPITDQKAGLTRARQVQAMKQTMRGDERERTKDAIRAERKKVEEFARNHPRRYQNVPWTQPTKK